MNENPAPQSGEDEPYTPASPVKRAMAWMGVVYMVIIVALNTYTLTTGNTLNGIPGILFAPACVGLGAIFWIRSKETQKYSHKLFAIIMVIVGLYNLVLGVTTLSALFGG